MYAAAMAFLKDPECAKDAVQTAMLRIYESISKGERPEYPPAYCMTVLKNTCVNTLNSQKHLTQLPDNDIEQSVDNNAEAVIYLSEVKDKLRQLPANERIAVEMRAYGGCSSQEIAALLGVTEPNARKLLSRGRMHLRNFFSNK